MSEKKMQYHLTILYLLISLSIGFASSKDKVKVRFYGEALCPFCRKFVTEVWQPIWNDLELRDFIDYDFIPWGNAYFETDECGSGPYNAEQRACWYRKCIDVSSDDDKKCFGSEIVIYQHGEKEGQTDIYEACVKKLFGLDFAVEFTYCTEGPNMDDQSMDAKALMNKCASQLVPQTDLDSIQQCLEEDGQALQITNAKQTPTHPGVPYVLIEGEPVEDFLHTKEVICSSLKKKGVTSLPKACEDTRTYWATFRKAITGSHGNIRK
jgi:hypothetical protein